MAVFPLFIQVENQPVLVVGAGNTSLRKVEKLLEFHCDITVISKEFLPEFSQLDVQCIHKEVDEKDIESTYLFVICATDDASVNKMVSSICQEKRIPVNVVDKPSLCTFIFPSIMHQKDVVTAVSSSGKSPLMSQYIRKNIEEQLPDTLGDINDRMGEIRIWVQEKVEFSKRKSILKKVLYRLIEEENQTSDQEIIEMIEGEVS